MKNYFAGAIMPRELDGSDYARMAKEMLAALREHKSGTTYYWRIGCDYSNGWYIATGWQDGYGPDGSGSTERLCMKVAYIPEDSLMMEYGYDFVMPFDRETGEVWDTEVSIVPGEGEQSVLSSIAWLMGEFAGMVTESRRYMQEAA